MTPRRPTSKSKARRSSRNALAVHGEHEQVSHSMDATAEFARLLTTEEVACVLKVHPRTLMRVAQDPRARFPKPLRLGRIVRWRADQLHAWMGDPR